MMNVRSNQATSAAHKNALSHSNECLRKFFIPFGKVQRKQCNKVTFKDDYQDGGVDDEVRVFRLADYL
jgi:hypothetical protein